MCFGTGSSSFRLWPRQDFMPSCITMPQYLAAPFVVLLLCLFLSAAFTVPLPISRLLSGVAVLQFVMFFGLVGLPALLHVIDIHPWHSREAERASYQQVAEKAAEMGLRPGDQIASLNASNLGNAMWAHLARVQIIAEVYYWPGQPEGASEQLLEGRSSDSGKGNSEAFPDGGPSCHIAGYAKWCGGGSLVGNWDNGLLPVLAEASR